MRTTRAGPGRAISAGSGAQLGPWQSFDVADGLPASSVLAILEDRQSRLWFGTHGGACRYDGEEYSIYTAEDGLASGAVYAIAQYRTGDLWFGTDSGTSCFDGRQFVTFTAADGLADSSVVCLWKTGGALCGSAPGAAE